MKGRQIVDISQSDTFIRLNGSHASLLQESISAALKDQDLKFAAKMKDFERKIHDSYSAKFKNLQKQLARVKQQLQAKTQQCKQFHQGISKPIIKPLQHSSKEQILSTQRNMPRKQREKRNHKPSHFDISERDKKNHVYLPLADVSINCQRVKIKSFPKQNISIGNRICLVKLKTGLLLLRTQTFVRIAQKKSCIFIKGAKVQQIFQNFLIFLGNDMCVYRLCYSDDQDFTLIRLKIGFDPQRLLVSNQHALAFSDISKHQIFLINIKDMWKIQIISKSDWFQSFTVYTNRLFAVDGLGRIMSSRDEISQERPCVLTQNPSLRLNVLKLYTIFSDNDQILLAILSSYEYTVIKQGKVQSKNSFGSKVLRSKGQDGQVIVHFQDGTQRYSLFQTGQIYWILKQ